jgi:hypothetical protein
MSASRVRRAATAKLIGAVAATVAVPLQAQHVTWSDATARTLEPGRVTVSLFAPARWGVGERTEIGMHPLFTFALPHFEVKHRFAEHGSWLFAMRHRLSYPTRFLALVAREGAGGLLPADTEVPVALQLDSDALFSAAWSAPHFVTFVAGFGVAPRLSGSEPPLLDFPFLISRFAPLYTVAVPRLAVAFSGPIAGRFFYESELRAYYLGLEPKTLAVETALELAWRPGKRLRAALGLRREHLRYAIGYRTHALPYADFAVAF